MTYNLTDSTLDDSFYLAHAPIRICILKDICHSIYAVYLLFLKIFVICLRQLVILSAVACHFLKTTSHL